MRPAASSQSGGSAVEAAPLATGPVGCARPRESGGRLEPFDGFGAARLAVDSTASLTWYVLRNQGRRTSAAAALRKSRPAAGSLVTSHESSARHRSSPPAPGPESRTRVIALRCWAQRPPLAKGGTLDNTDSVCRHVASCLQQAGPGQGPGPLRLNSEGRVSLAPSVGGSGVSALRTQ